jgi:hypothetical protein
MQNKLNANKHINHKPQYIRKNKDRVVFFFVIFRKNEAFFSIHAKRRSVWRESLLLCSTLEWLAYFILLCTIPECRNKSESKHCMRRTIFQRTRGVKCRLGKRTFRDDDPGRWSGWRQKCPFACADSQCVWMYVLGFPITETDDNFGKFGKNGPSVLSVLTDYKQIEVSSESLTNFIHRPKLRKISRCPLFRRFGINLPNC